MRIENMAVLGDEERGPAPAVCSQRTRQRVIYKPQCPNLSTQESWGKACSVPIVKDVPAVRSDICALFIFYVKCINKCVTIHKLLADCPKCHVMSKLCV